MMTSNISFNSRKWLYHVMVRAHAAWTGQYGPVSVGCTHSAIIPNPTILFHKRHKTTTRRGGSILQTMCLSRTTTGTVILHLQTSNQNSPILTQFTPTLKRQKNGWISPQHTQLALIAQLYYKGHPGVAVSRSWPLPSPWWSPASLMSLCLVSAY